MSNSPLVSYTKISPHRTSPRNHKIDTITIHHMAGNLSIESCGNVFQNREASSNYGVGTDGRIGMYVEEKDRSWASANAPNDHRAVTIEVANSSSGGNWPVSDKALESTINLCVDICRRNGIERLNYTGNKNGNLTMHKWFYPTTCPGPYLESKFPYIASEVNKRLGAEVPTTEEQNASGEFKVNLRVLYKGCTGEDVRSLQILLNGRGYDCGVYGADGVFGADTDSAVRKFQSKNGLVVDGEAGIETMSLLMGVAK